MLKLQFLVGVLFLLSTATHAQPVQVDGSFNMPKRWDLNPFLQAPSLDYLNKRQAHSYCVSKTAQNGAGLPIQE